jgi:hypothetical protein
MSLLPALAALAASPHVPSNKSRMPGRRMLENVDGQDKPAAPPAGILDFAVAGV